VYILFSLYSKNIMGNALNAPKRPRDDDDGNAPKRHREDDDGIVARRNAVIKNLQSAREITQKLSQENLKQIIEDPIPGFGDPIDVIQLIECDDVYDLTKVIPKAIEFISKSRPVSAMGADGKPESAMGADGKPEIFNAFWVSAHGVYLSYDDFLVNIVTLDLANFKKKYPNLLPEEIEDYKYSEDFLQRMGEQNSFGDYKKQKEERKTEWKNLYKSLFKEVPSKYQIAANEKLTNPVITQGFVDDFTIEKRWAYKFEAANGHPPSEDDKTSFINDLGRTVLVRQTRDMCGMMLHGSEWHDKIQPGDEKHLSSRQQENVVILMMMRYLHNSKIIITTNIIQLYIFFTRRILRRMFLERTSDMKAGKGEDKKWINDTREGAVESWGVNTPRMEEQANQYTFTPNPGEVQGLYPNYGLHMMNTNKSIHDANLIVPGNNATLDKEMDSKIRVPTPEYSLTDEDKVWNRKIKMARIALQKLIDNESADIVDIVLITSVSGINLTPIFDSACQHTTANTGTLTRTGFHESILRVNPHVRAEPSPPFDSQMQPGESEDESEDESKDESKEGKGKRGGGYDGGGKTRETRKKGKRKINSKRKKSKKNNTKRKTKRNKRNINKKKQINSK
jgi:hypothetical protein